MLNIPIQHKFLDLFPGDNSISVNAKTQTCIPFSSILKWNEQIKDGGNFTGRFSQSSEGFPRYIKNTNLAYIVYPKACFSGWKLSETMTTQEPRK